MSTLIEENLPVVMGNCIRVDNVDKLDDKEPDQFICIQVENETGKEEYPILLTEDEFKNIKRWLPNEMKTMIAGRIYIKFFVDANYYCVKLRIGKNKSFVGIFRISDWIKYFKRAAAHPKSCTKKNIITDILD